MYNHTQTRGHTWLISLILTEFQLLLLRRLCMVVTRIRAGARGPSRQVLRVRRCHRAFDSVSSGNLACPKSHQDKIFEGVSFFGSVCDHGQALHLHGQLLLLPATPASSSYTRSSIHSPSPVSHRRLNSPRLHCPHRLYTLVFSRLLLLQRVNTRHCDITRLFFTSLPASHAPYDRGQPKSWRRSFQEEYGSVCVYVLNV